MSSSCTMSLLEKLQCCGSVLEALRGRPAFAKVSDREGQRALEMVRAAKDEDWPRVLDVVRKLGFSPAVEEALLDSVAEKMVEDPTASPPPCKAGRTSTQSYESWLGVVPAAVWGVVRAGQTDELYDHLGQLGLRNPSEATSTLLASAVLHQTEGFERAMSMSPETRLKFIKTTKHTFKHRSKKWLPVSYIAVLPESHEDLKKLWPSVHSAALGDAVPIASPIPAVELQTLRTMTPMRAPKASAPQREAPTIQLKHRSSSAFDPQDFVAFGQKLLTQAMGHASEGSSPMWFRNSSSSMLPLPGSGKCLAIEPPKPPTVEDKKPLPLSAPPIAQPQQLTTGKSVDAVAAEIAAELDSRTSDSKGAAPKAKAKGKATTKSKAKAKATTAKSVACIDLKAAPMPRLEKVPPVKFGTCTVHTDVKNRRWRAIEASNRRRDVKFNWKDGSETKVVWGEVHPVVP